MDRTKDTSDYQAAGRYKFTLRHRLSFYLAYLRINVVALLLLVPEGFKGLFHLVFGKKPKSIAGQVAVVTGGGNGLGRAIAFRLAKERCMIAVADIDFLAAQQTAKDIEAKYNVKALPYTVDVSKHEQVTRLRDDIEKTLGNVDILVNNAGLLSMELSLREKTPEAIQKVVDVNLTSHFWVKYFTRKFIRPLISNFRTYNRQTGPFWTAW